MNGPVAPEAKKKKRIDKRHVGPVAEKAKKKKRKRTEMMNGTDR
jgi:hypothetical protein